MTLDYESTSTNLVFVIRNMLNLLSKNADIPQDDPVVTEFRTAAAKLVSRLIFATTGVFPAHQKS